MRYERKEDKFQTIFSSSNLLVTSRMTPVRERIRKNTLVACLRNVPANIQESIKKREKKGGERRERRWEISHYGQCAWPRHTRQTVSHSLIVS